MLPDTKKIRLYLLTGENSSAIDSAPEYGTMLLRVFLVESHFEPNLAHFNRMRDFFYIPFGAQLLKTRIFQHLRWTTKKKFYRIF